MHTEASLSRLTSGCFFRHHSQPGTEFFQEEDAKLGAREALQVYMIPTFPLGTKPFLQSNSTTPSCHPHSSSQSWPPLTLKAYTPSSTLSMHPPRLLQPRQRSASAPQPVPHLTSLPPQAAPFPAQSLMSPPRARTLLSTDPPTCDGRWEGDEW